MGIRCPYPEFYEKTRSTAVIANGAEPAPALPIDDRGACIFHSQDAAWKRGNDFEGKFLQLVRLLNAYEDAKYYDFAEFVFVGSEIRTASGSEEHVLRISDMAFRRQAYFMAASFLDSFELDGVEFQDGARFGEATFARNLRIENTRFRGLDFTKAKVAQLAFFIKVEFLSFALFENVRFTGIADGYAVRFEDDRFQGIAEFSGAVFDVESSVGFLKVQFEDFTDFRGTQFNCHVAFSDVSFASVTEFIDTLFDTVDSTARYRGAAVEFNRIEVPVEAVLTFMSTDLEKKMFNHDVQMSFKQDLAGIIRLENVNFNRFTPDSKDRLTQLALEGRTGTALSTSKESAVINAVDGVSALLGTFFRVGVRIALGAWKEADTKALLGAIRFNDEGAESRALSLHRVIIDKYTGRALFGFNHQQNELLIPMDVKSRNMLAPQKIRILFLGANSLISPLELDKEVRKIQTSLKLAKERDNLDLKQEWAVTVDTLMQAMLDESPTIVHFSGHGKESGIVLQDEIDEPKVVSPDALSDLFKLFKDTVRCVVLNSCYSESQARAIRQHIPYVIGMRSGILDSAAVAFSTGFYKALGAGKNIPFAFDMGRASIRLEGFSDESNLVLL